MIPPLTHLIRSSLAGLGLCCAASGLLAADAPKITPAKDLIGFSIGDDYHMANYTQISTLWKKWATESNRVKMVSYGTTEEGRPMYMMIISSPENLAKLEHYRQLSVNLAHAQMGEAEARALAKAGKAVVWIDGGLHSTESVNGQQLTQLVYDMLSLTDEDTLRFLNDDILVAPIANPDGVEIVANWYMREEDEKKRSMLGIPRLYNKYVGHDDNRDSIMNNMKETMYQNRVLFVDWIPQIMYNHHQRGPEGTVIFIPPFRDPFNYNFDPLIPLGIEAVSVAMHSALIAQGMGGSVMRSAAPYSTWWNGGMRTATYFHNQIGILTEIVGGPTPEMIPFVPSKQLPSGDWPLPISPREWHYRDSIRYSLVLDRAILDYASRYRETLLFDIYTMGRHNIEKGSHDYWTVTPKRIAAVMEAAKGMAPEPGGRRGRRGAAAAGAPAAGGDAGQMQAIMALFGQQSQAVPASLYNTVLHDPAFRDPRAFIIPSDQDDFATATKFINVLLKQGVTVERATSTFQVNGKSYPTGSYVVQAAQAFRPEVMDMFERQDHPTDLEYPGGPPKRPYDITGWTPAVQMGVKFDRIIEAVDGPFETLSFDLLKPPVEAVTGVSNPAGYLVSHKINDAFVLTNRLLKANCDVYWIKDEQTVEGRGYGTGTLWIPATANSTPIVQDAAKNLGVPAYGIAKAPSGDAMKLKPIRIALVDLYGGVMPTGWLRWMFEQYEFPYEVVYPQILDAGGLKSSFDVIVFPSETYTAGGRWGRGSFHFDPPAESIPEEYRSMLGKITANKTIPPLRKFVDEGGTVLAIGSSATIGEAMGLPVTDHCVETTADGKVEHISGDKFYVPGSVLEADFDNTDPLAYGMPKKGYLFFDSSPVFDLDATSPVKANPVITFTSDHPLYSGWAMGDKYLKGGLMATEASLGQGKLVLIALEATFRATPHATFKLLFNGLYYGSATPVTLP